MLFFLSLSFSLETTRVRSNVPPLTSGSLTLFFQISFALPLSSSPPQAARLVQNSSEMPAPAGLIARTVLNHRRCLKILRFHSRATRLRVAGATTSDGTRHAANFASPLSIRFAVATV